MSKPATQLGSFFTSLKLENGEERTTFTDTIPDWLKEACGEAMHHDMGDWLYDECEAVCDAVDEGRLTDEDSIHEYVDGRVDVYTKAVFQWAADYCLTDTFAEAQERASEMGTADDATLEDRIKAIQYCAIEHITQTIMAAIEENGKEESDEEDAE